MSADSVLDWRSPKRCRAYDRPFSICTLALPASCLTMSMNERAFMTTVERHFLDRKGRNPHATEEFSWLLSGITLPTKIIAAYVQRAGLLEVMGATGRLNVQGGDVQKLHEFANQTLVRCLAYRGNIGILVSEEDEE